MKYERLTERNEGDVTINCKQCEYHEKLMICTDYSCIDSLKNRLAELEDKIENGELVENKVVTYVNMARSDSKTLIDKAIKYDKLKNKIENGTMVELPCKVGDTVWELDLFSKAKIREIKARNLLQIFHWIDDESFGKFLFLTKAEAENKLADELKELEE